MSAFLMPFIEGLVAGLVVAFITFLVISRTQQRSAGRILAAARAEAAAVVSNASAKAEEARSQLLLEGRMEVLRQREDLEKEVVRRREEWERQDRRAEERERSIDRRSEEAHRQESALQTREGAVAQREETSRVRAAEIERLAGEQRQRLEAIAGLTSEEARREVLQRAEDEARGQAQALGRDIREQAKRSADKDAKKIVSLAVQRIAAEHTAETTVSAVALPTDEMKGRIIGREGRNV
ncbi:MAG: Rnase Y domain-containing protein, partial [Gemmatimonadota bacterium]|nr:Rnase Y domain-containing protein [Gemmatimonadota bacterium]